jgi:glycosyltransferase involved in cell wall biosynthesis
MKILHVTHSMNPAQGGLTAYLGAIVPALAALGHDSEIVCLDSPKSDFIATTTVPTHALGPALLGYGYSSRLADWLRAACPRFDAVIVHGLWQYPGLAVRRALAGRAGPRYFVFAHGMLDPWFKRRFPLKHFKKWLYWRLAEHAVLRDAAAVVFTCEEERRLARQSFAGGYPESVVRFGTAAPPDEAEAQKAAFFHRHPGLREKPFWLFLGRIHPKKGLALLLNAYAALSATGDAPLPHLVIAGPCADAAYLDELQACAKKHGLADRIVWSGMINGAEKWGALRAADAFVLPSHQENFGIAVVEALACGTPVLISHQVNIWREIVADGAGLAGPDTSAGTLHGLSAWQSLDEDQRGAMRAAAVRTFATRYEIGAVAKSLLTVLGARVPELVHP